MKLIFAILVAVSGFVWAQSAAASSAKPVALICHMERLGDKETLQFSFVFNEAERTVIINDTVFPNSEFTSYRVKGKKSYPYYGIAGVSRVTDFSLDRLTGTLSFGTLPAVDKGGEFTEEQKEKIASSPLDPAFLGKCALGKPMF